MKVWCILTFLGPEGQQTTIVAASSQRKAVGALNAAGAYMSLYEFRQYSSTTGNAEELAVALAKPGSVFYRSIDYHGKGGWCEVVGTLTDEETEPT